MKIVRSSTLWLMVLLFIAAVTVRENPGNYTGTWYGDQNPEQPLIIAENGTYTSDELTDGTWEGPKDYSIQLRSREEAYYTLEHVKTSFSNAGWSFSGDALCCHKTDTWYFRIEETARQSYELRHPTKTVDAQRFLSGFWTARENDHETFHFREDNSFTLIYSNDQGNPETFGGTYSVLNTAPLNIEKTEWDINLHFEPELGTPLTEKAAALTESGNWHISKQEDILSLEKISEIPGSEVVFYQSIKVK